MGGSERGSVAVLHANERRSQAGQQPSGRARDPASAARRGGARAGRRQRGDDLAPLCETRCACLQGYDGQPVGALSKSVAAQVSAGRRPRRRTTGATRSAAAPSCPAPHVLVSFHEVRANSPALYTARRLALWACSSLHRESRSTVENCFQRRADARRGHWFSFEFGRSSSTFIAFHFFIFKI